MTGRTVLHSIARIWYSFRWLAVPAVVAPLFFMSLGSTPLWQDEAQTALLARHVLRYGVPMVGDGPDSASALVGRDATPSGLFVHVPPLQAYLAAGSLLVFGESAWAARLPFALSGWACVVLLPWYLRRASAAEKAAAQLILGTHVPFLLYSRQCRYYGPAALGLLVSCGAACAVSAAFRQGRRPGWKTFGLLVVGLAGTALTFEFSFVAALVGSAVTAATAWRGVQSNWRRLAVAFALPMAVFLWWQWISQGAPSRQIGQGFNDDAPDVPWFFLGQLNAYGIPLLWMVTVSAITLLAAPRRLLATERERLILLGLGWAVILVQATVATYTTHRFFRYVVPTLPVAVATATLTFGEMGRAWCGRRAWVVAGPAWLACAAGLWSTRATDGQAYWPWEQALERSTGVRWSRRADVHLGSFLNELRRPPRGPVAAVVDYLNNHASRNEVLVAEYSEKPLKFHTRVAVYGGETGEFPARAPDWVWRRPFRSLWWEVKRTRRWIDEHVDPRAYEPIVLAGVSDSLWENRPDPEVHVFADAARPGPPVVLWRRVVDKRAVEGSAPAELLAPEDRSISELDRTKLKLPDSLVGPRGSGPLKGRGGGPRMPVK